ncbi:hypothetical protein SDC9_133463 [bioreactor metagenome]|uniref:Uncharacterized protein n=1 Tax=bioreactor metagenome TaxID=1076179 RepID=A0A645DAK1_9ZZZZ
MYRFLKAVPTEFHLYFGSYHISLRFCAAKRHIDAGQSFSILDDIHIIDKILSFYLYADVTFVSIDFVAHDGVIYSEIKFNLITCNAIYMTFFHRFPNIGATVGRCYNSNKSVAITSGIARMLVGGADNPELISFIQSVKHGTFIIAWSHVMQIRKITKIFFRQSVTGKYFNKRCFTFFEEIPVITSESFLITHMMWSYKSLFSFQLILQIRNGSCFHQRRIEAIIQRYMITIFHAMILITQESQEFTFFVILISHLHIFFPSGFTQTLESRGMVIDYP